MESPELWFEDFGSAGLRRGRVRVKLDADFAEVIATGDYRVFLTPEGDCNGLYVAKKSGAAFEVRELGGGKSSVNFSYRIVGRRKDVKRRQRFARIGLPKSAPVSRKRRPARPVRALIAELEKQARAVRAKKPKGGRAPAAAPRTDPLLEALAEAARERGEDASS
jgi:hypothetical protein